MGRDERAWAKIKTETSINERRQRRLRKVGREKNGMEWNRIEESREEKV
jgi:hypothetical protein